MTETVHVVVWTPRMRAAALHRYLPFSVPAGARSIEVRLEYDRAVAVIDLGCMGPNGFRGWSGGARDRFVIGVDAATGGYLPGEPEPGEWSVMLGLHRVPGPVECRVTVSVTDRSFPVDPVAHPSVPVHRPRRALPADTGLAWVAGDLHCHSQHSDGSLSLPELAASAVTAGLDFLAVTDHNTVSHHPALPDLSRRYGVSLLPGQEVTTDRGHANVFGDIGWIDFRRPAEHWVSTVSKRGGLMSVNHPIATDCAWRQELPVRPTLAEVWHCTWRDRTWGGPLAWWLAWGTDTVPVGGSDFHSPGRDRPLGEPITWVATEDGDPGTNSILAGLAAGRVAVSAGRSGPVLLPVDGQLVAVDADGMVLSDMSGRRTVVRGDRVRLPALPGPAWLEAPDTTIVALTGVRAGV